MFYSLIVLHVRNDICNKAAKAQCGEKKEKITIREKKKKKKSN